MSLRNLHLPGQIRPGRHRTGILKIAILIVLVLATTLVAGSVMFLDAGNRSMTVAENAIAFNVFSGEFTTSVNEVGDIESSSNVEIRCRVKSKGRLGTTLLELVPEGTKAQKGDFLCQLDDSLLQDELTSQKIQTARNRASVIQAESVLATAKSKLLEYKDGSYEQERAEMLAAITVAKESQRRATDMRTYSEALNRKGYMTKTQLEADSFAEEKAKLELKLAEDRLRVYEKFTRTRVVAEFEAEIRRQNAELEAAQYMLQLSQQRESDFAEQVCNCRVVAPQAGTVVYANQSDRRDSSVVIEEGVTLRDGQVIFYLPDPQSMQVKAKVNDSKINKVKVDQDVQVRIDTAPENAIAGRVVRVSPYPNPRRYYQAPIEYDVFVEITEQNPSVRTGLRTGLRAKVEIFVERVADVIQAPVSSLIHDKGNYSVFVKTAGGVEQRSVKIGSNNEKYVIIEEGLEVGEQVLLDADNYVDQQVDES